MRRGRAVNDNALGERQEVAAVNLEVLPLLRAVGGKLLERLESAIDQLEHRGESVQFVRASAGAQARRRQKGAPRNREEFDIFTPGDRKTLMFYKLTVLPTVDQRIYVAVATVHLRGTSWNVARQLSNG